MLSGNADLGGEHPADSEPDKGNDSVQSRNHDEKNL